jgi:hypothetical protein
MLGMKSGKYDVYHQDEPVGTCNSWQRVVGTVTSYDAVAVGVTTSYVGVTAGVVVGLGHVVGLGLTVGDRTRLVGTHWVTTVR